MEITNQLGRTRVEEDDRWVFSFANGLVVHTDPFLRADPQRVLPLGGPQDVILNRLVAEPGLVRDRRVFEPFAGSGGFGLMALKLGARHVDFLDVNPRAVEFEKANAQRNGFPTDRYACHLESVASYEPSEPYDLVLANPPFVPTPPGVQGTLTSDGGPEGSDLAAVLFQRLPALLRPEGEAFVYIMQLATADGPLIAKDIPDQLPGRTVDFTSTQESAIPFPVYVAAYRQCFPLQADEIERWSARLTARHGAELSVQHYVVHVGPERPGPARCTLSSNLLEKYGIAPYASESNAELALGRVLENVVPGSG